MSKKILITGGAGFIGSHLVDTLIGEGHNVVVLDKLVEQVHGKKADRPVYLNKVANFIRGDVCKINTWRKVLKSGVDVIFHFAAEVGIGQSMYEIRRYMEANTLGTANLFDVIVKDKINVGKIVVASSMSIYGEGTYECRQCGVIYPKLRDRVQLERGYWEIRCPKCNSLALPCPTREDKSLAPTSVYAISKRDQEELVLNVGKAYGIPTVALRLFNVYGPRQALSNPYTGVAAIFSSRLLNGNPPLIFEDGLQSRDFIHVKDVIQACMLVLEKEAANGNTYNVGTGKQTTILKMAKAISKSLGLEIEPQVVNRFREGDIRHCFPDITKISSNLGFSPKITFEEGVKDLIGWVKNQSSDDLVNKAISELKERGLIV